MIRNSPTLSVLRFYLSLLLNAPLCSPPGLPALSLTSSATTRRWDRSCSNLASTCIREEQRESLAIRCTEPPHLMVVDERSPLVSQPLCLGPQLISFRLECPILGVAMSYLLGPGLCCFPQLSESSQRIPSFRENRLHRCNRRDCRDNIP